MRNAEVENNLITLNNMATKHFPVKLSFAIAVNIEELMKWHKRISRSRSSGSPCWSGMGRRTRTVRASRRRVITSWRMKRAS